MDDACAHEMQMPNANLNTGVLHLESYEGYYNLCHNDILMESPSVESFANLLLEISDCKCWDLYLYKSFELIVLFLADGGIWPNVPKLTI